MKKIMLVILIYLLASCAHILPPTAEELRNADYGSYPNDYKEIAQAYLERLLFDPYSAVYSDWQSPSSGWYRDYKGLFFGFRVCVRVNAKNRMGGYVGQKVNYFLIKDGTILIHEGGNYKSGTIGEQRLYKLCSY